MHYCLGANLARREIAEALNVVTSSTAQPATRRTGAVETLVSLSGPLSLPIEFD